MPAELVGWLPQTSAVGLLLLAVWLVLTGRIVPKVHHDEVRRDRDTYRDAAQTATTAAAQMSDHVGKLVTAVEQVSSNQRESLDLLRQSLDLLRRLVSGPAPTDRTAA